MPYTKHVVIPAYGRIDGTAITGSYQTVITATNDCYSIQVFNTCDNPIILSMDGGTTEHYELDGEGFHIDGRANDFQFGKPTIQVKHAGSAPTQGSLRITLLQI